MASINMKQTDPVAWLDEYRGKDFYGSWPTLKEMFDIISKKYPENNCLTDFDGPGGRIRVRGCDHHTSRCLSCFRVDADDQVTEVFRTDDVHSDYIETMIENRFGVKGGMRTLGANAVPIQYNMLLNKLTPSADNDSGRRYL